MTCIVGINTGKKIIIAGDRMGSNTFTYMQLKYSKVFKKGDFIFGVCGSPRVMQLLRHKLVLPKRFVGQSVEEYIYNDFTDSVFKLLDINNSLETKDGRKSFCGEFLFGYENELYMMQENFQTILDCKKYNATGSGCFHAISSMYSTEGLNITPKERLKKAIVCASEFVMSVDNKIDTVELIYEEDEKLKKKVTTKSNKKVK